MSFLIALTLLAGSQSVRAKVAWDLANCQKSFTAATKKAGHVCTAPHLDADLAPLVSGLKRPFPPGEIESGGVETGAAQSLLGTMYEHGRDVPPNLVRAFVWYRRSAELGNPAGQLSLGFMYSEGRGTYKDYTQAYKWFKLSTEHATGDLRSLSSSALDRVAKKMTPRQITKGRRLASEWAAASRRGED